MTDFKNLEPKVIKVIHFCFQQIAPINFKKTLAITSHTVEMTPRFFSFSSSKE